MKNRIGNARAEPTLRSEETRQKKKSKIKPLPPIKVSNGILAHLSDDNLTNTMHPVKRFLHLIILTRHQRVRTNSTRLGVGQFLLSRHVGLIGCVEFIRCKFMYMYIMW